MKVCPPASISAALLPCCRIVPTIFSWSIGYPSSTSRRRSRSGLIALALARDWSWRATASTIFCASDGWSCACRPSTRGVRLHRRRRIRRASPQGRQGPLCAEDSSGGSLGWPFRRLLRLALGGDLVLIQVPVGLGSGIEAQVAALAGRDAHVVQRDDPRQVGDVAREGAEVVVLAGHFHGDRQFRVVLADIGLARTEQFEVQATT